MESGRPDKAADEVAQTGDVLSVVRVEPVINGEDRMGRDSPLAMKIT
jgi:hypothetical protein